MSKKEIEELASQCRALGWSVEKTAKGFFKIVPPNGDPIISPGSTNGRQLSNFKAELNRAGFNPDAALVASQERAANALAADRKRNDAALARAAERAREAATAPAPPVTTPSAPVPAAQVIPALSNPFTPPALLTAATEEISEAQMFKLLAGYPRDAVLITQPQAAKIMSDSKEAQEHGGCRQRRLYSANAAKLQQGMELGEFELNPADSLVFCKEHNSIVNGQHRMAGLENADPEFINEFYPEGVPFYVTTGFPCAMSHIFDTGKARSAADALTVEGLQGWGPLPASALRLALNYDQSFEPGGITYWPQWRKIIYTNTELVQAAAIDYRGLLQHNSVVGRAYSRSRVTRSASMVAAFVIERDNPGGAPAKKDRPAKTNEQFWRGICGDDDMQAGDPRIAVVRFAMRTGSKYGADNGATMLAHLLKGYANWMIGKRLEMSQINRELPMVPVWQPEMRWFGQELRFSKIGSSE